MKYSLASRIAAFMLALFAFLPVCASAEGEKPMSKEEVEALVKKTIQDNPDLIFDTLYAYQQRTMAERMSRATLNLIKLQDKIKHDEGSPSIGNPKGDVTIAEFFDYHCGYCKRFFPQIPQLLKEDKNIHFVFKEFPILSADSKLAAKAALAVYSIDPKKYFDYHIVLMGAREKYTEKLLTDEAEHIGIDPEVFKKALANPDIEKNLEATRKLAHDLSIDATPAIIVGTELLPGAVSYEDLKEKVQEVRDAMKQKNLESTKTN